MRISGRTLDNDVLMKTWRGDQGVCKMIVGFKKFKDIRHMGTPYIGLHIEKQNSGVFIYTKS